MTRATCNADNTITEQSGMEAPRPPRNGIHDYDWDIYLKKRTAYNKAVAACRTIVCSPECRGLWAAGQTIEEGKDYEVKSQFLYSKDPDVWKTFDQPFYRDMAPERFIAFPLAVKSEDITERTFSFDETLGYLIDFGNMVLRNRDRLKWDMSNDAAEWLADQLKKIHHH